MKGGNRQGEIYLIKLKFLPRRQKEIGMVTVTHVPGHNRERDGFLEKKGKKKARRS